MGLYFKQIMVYYSHIVSITNKEKYKMSRKRKASESFAQYRANMKREARMLKERLQGNWLHISTDLTAVKGSGYTYTR